MSGYTPCGCHDCFDVAISNDVNSPDLCGECERAGCTNHHGRPSFLTVYGMYNECQRWEDAEDAL